MGKRSREKRERFANQGLNEGGKERQLKSKTDLERVCLFIITGGTYLALFTPLIMSADFFFPFVSPKSLYFMGFTQIIFFAWLFLIFYFPQYRPRKNPIFLALILFLIVLSLSSLLGENFSNSFWSKPERMTGLLMWFYLFAFFLVISSVFRKKEDWQRIFAISIFVGLILSFITFFSANPAMRGGATIGNSSFLGTYLIFTLFLAIYLIFTSKKKIIIYAAVCFLIMSLSLFLSGARAATFSFLFGLILLFFLWLAFCQRRNLRRAGVTLLVISIISVLSFAFFALQPESFIRKEIIEKNFGETFGGRTVVWEGAWKGFLQRPALGWGLENFEYPFTKNYDSCMGTSRCGGDIWYDKAHNIIFDTLVTVGFLGMLTYIGIFLSAFYVLWKKYLALYVSSVSNISEEYRETSFENSKQKTKSLEGGIDFWAAGIFSVVLVSYSIQNLTVFDMVSSYLMFFLVLGFVAGLTTSGEESASQKNISPGPADKFWKDSSQEKSNLQNSSKFFYKANLWFLFIFSILFVLSFFYFIIHPLKTSHYTIAALRAPVASEERLDLYKKALGASSLGKYQIREFFGQTTLQFAQSEQVKQVPAENFKKELNFVIEELEKSVIESPLDLRSQLKLGQLYSAYAVLLDEAKIFDAERVLEKAIEISPTNQQGYWALAQARLYQGKVKEALSLAEKAIALEPELFQSHYMVIQIAKMTEDYELVERKIQEAIEINPDWEADLVSVSN